MNLKNLVSKFRGQAKQKVVTGVPVAGLPSLQALIDEIPEEQREKLAKALHEQKTNPVSPEEFAKKLK